MTEAARHPNRDIMRLQIVGQRAAANALLTADSKTRNAVIAPRAS
jgi:hypothetical protein